MRVSLNKPAGKAIAIFMGLLFLGIGIFLGVLSFKTIKDYKEKSKTYIEVVSKVVDYEYDGKGLQAIVVEYNVDGQKYRKVSDSYSNMPKPIGTEVSVKYNPRNPKDAIWTHDSTNIVMPIASVFSSLIGVIIIVVGIVGKRFSYHVTTYANNTPDEDANGLYTGQETNNLSRVIDDNKLYQEPAPDPSLVKDNSESDKLIENFIAREEAKMNNTQVSDNQPINPDTNSNQSINTNNNDNNSVL